MDSICKKFTEARVRKNLTLEEVSQKTKIRPHLLKAIEDGNLNVLPAVYITSFIKTYAQYLHIPENEYSELITQLNKNSAPDYDNTLKSSRSLRSEAEFVDSAYEPVSVQSKKPPFSLESKTNLVNYFIYAALTIAVVLLLYFTFFADGKSRIQTVNVTESQASKHGDTTVIEPRGRSLLSILENKDSLTLEARATDTAWIKIDIDGKRSEEILFTPNMERSWSAMSYIIISQGNVGAIKFFRNGTQLEPFGRYGSVVKNVKITPSQVILPSPVVKDSSVAPAPREYPQPRKLKKQKKTVPKLIEPSEIQSPRPFKR